MLAILAVLSSFIIGHKVKALSPYERWGDGASGCQCVQAPSVCKWQNQFRTQVLSDFKAHIFCEVTLVPHGLTVADVTGSGPWLLARWVSEVWLSDFYDQFSRLYLWKISTTLVHCGFDIRNCPLIGRSMPCSRLFCLPAGWRTCWLFWFDWLLLYLSSCCQRAWALVAEFSDNFFLFIDNEHQQKTLPSKERLYLCQSSFDNS